LVRQNRGAIVVFVVDVVVVGIVHFFSGRRSRFFFSVGILCVLVVVFCCGPRREGHVARKGAYWDDMRESTVKRFGIAVCLLTSQLNLGRFA
jgi:hypothetical protein